MKIVVKKPDPDPPYSLHDAHIMELQAERDTLRLLTQYGYVRTEEPLGQVDGDVELTGVDLESSYVYIMEYQDVLCGNCGSFSGKKMTLETFLREYSDATLDIMDESYGFRLAVLGGFLNLRDRILEFKLEIYYTGEVRYLLKE
ncbi:hypothetical protein DWX58_02770 [Pseudoflavonifractor sp. AF19-9AC]|uniref:hypothetical protein n=1 Tax=Pseudoflavonifractor sp. AF19-9AC TaxID=2292244 RepID=UPI000E532E1E|nr:hypothetical protein [Pseudoflavonifractor sp. AF19-9AC]RHR11381.1 hypothetical protein DWX58_02770 [Pseudoflavonifractor sp. AF19-9AC]